jgi:hypothetical protein
VLLRARACVWIIKGDTFYHQMMMCNLRGNKLLVRMAYCTASDAEQQHASVEQHVLRVLRSLRCVRRVTTANAREDHNFVKAGSPGDI